jgi:hypothetical protein
MREILQAFPAHSKTVLAILRYGNGCTPGQPVPPNRQASPLHLGGDWPGCEPPARLAWESKWAAKEKIRKASQLGGRGLGTNGPRPPSTPLLGCYSELMGVGGVVGGSDIAGEPC